MPSGSTSAIADVAFGSAAVVRQIYSPEAAFGQMQIFTIQQMRRQVTVDASICGIEALSQHNVLELVTEPCPFGEKQSLYYLRNGMIPNRAL